MKKLLCFLLSCLLVFNSVSVVYADTKSSFNPYEQFKKNHPDWYDSNGNVIPAGNTFFSKMVVPALIEAGETSGEIVSSLVESVGDFIKSFDNSNGDVSIKYKDNGQPVTESNYNENNFYITYSPKFLNGLNDKLQDKVHALDGYYLIDPYAGLTINNLCNFLKQEYNYDLKKQSVDTYNEFLSYTQSLPFMIYAKESYYSQKNLDYQGECYIPSVWESYGKYLCLYADSNGTVHLYDYRDEKLPNYSAYFFRGFSKWLGGQNFYFSLPSFLSGDVCVLGSPLKIFYSKYDAKNYYSNGRTYVPQLPSTNITIPLAYVNGTLNLPDFNINLDSLVGKAESEIQNDIDNQFKLYLDKLAEININPSQPTNPTPTPSGGGSGDDFGDGTTPTPAPDFTDGLKDTNDYLKQILEKVTSILQIDTDFSKSFETVSQNLCKYLESNNEKLDQIITAINALSNGKTEDEVNGCKYDFTQLSQSLTTLWNDSDQKFDQMIKLLEENNKYQEKIIGDLNDIKAILIAQTALDAFQNRSQETANKAKGKFPTSIPWDIALIVNTFSAEPEPIKFELPINVNSLNINETITVDLSTGEWEKLGKLCRYMLSVLFILFLIQLSRKLFSNGGDE